MSDTPADVSPAGDSVGDRVDAAVENLRTEVNARIDTLQATVEELSAKVDAAQGQLPNTQVPPAEPA